MSDLTPCNYCTRMEIERRAKERGATVTIRQMTHRDGEMAGWYELSESDRDKPSAYFMQLTVGCAC